MSPIEEFLARYVKEFDYYEQAARLAARLLESNLQAAGVRSIVTSRAKSAARLEQKCRQRNMAHAYKSVDDIFDDIVDLAGVRVALYFPAEREQVDRLIGRLFSMTEPRREFPSASRTDQSKRFSGYSALHYRVHLKPQDLNESDRYASARIEIQVASVLMHAWAEVEHDLVYKPIESGLSDEEYSLLDQLNGLVLAGEIGLERLQKAGEARVAFGGRRFENHYELAAHLLSTASAAYEEPVTDSGLGRVDLLFELLDRLQLGTPDELRPYLELLHGNLEVRPLAEQIIDALLAEDPERYKAYELVRAEAGASGRKLAPGDESIYRATGFFLTRWVTFEKLVRELRSDRGSERLAMPTIRVLDEMELLDPETRFEIDQLRRLRNNLVHGGETPPADYLHEAAQRLEAIVERITHGRPSPS